MNTDPTGMCLGPYCNLRCKTNSQSNNASRPNSTPAPKIYYTPGASSRSYVSSGTTVTFNQYSVAKQMEKEASSMTYNAHTSIDYLFPSQVQSKYVELTELRANETYNYNNLKAVRMLEQEC